MRKVEKYFAQVREYVHMQPIKTISLVGDRYRFLVTGEQSGGAFAMFDFHCPSQHGPPPHVHHREDEAFYVLEGEFDFSIDGQTVHAKPGDTIFGKRDIPHTFRCVSETAGRMIVTVAPAGLENFFAEVGVELPTPDSAPLPPPPDEIQRLIAAAPRYGLELLIPG